MAALSITCLPSSPVRNGKDGAIVLDDEPEPLEHAIRTVRAYEQQLHPPLCDGPEVGNCGGRAPKDCP